MKQGILNLSREEVTEFLADKGVPKYRMTQIFTWLLRFGKTNFAEMSNIDISLRLVLDKLFYIYRPKIIRTNKSIDGTVKFLLELTDKNTIETVFIPERQRNTICVSSQVGCAIGCKFCNTGYHGFIRNLSTEEIVSQFLIVKDYLDLWHSQTERLSNVVFMGMGEPLLNYENVLKSINLLILDEKDHISRRKITLSTSGITDVLKNSAKDLPCRLAISLHAPNDSIRSKIMPINNIYNIKSILESCREYEKYHEYLKITFEYLLLDGVNDSIECAYELLNLLSGRNFKVNLLQFNSWPGCKFKPSPRNRVLNFAKILENGGVEAPIRMRRGEDIMAACGQLKST
ncbi:MAG: 23S rRNA (adenine(2503)-C(2))-methyltransferase RlmN [Holosporales bacterium]|jgi:23S rRNA (adenine2503-C2)-methyltransferase|nr:23S rRNA (adenine(2503)-C(2))-methyltransferase RlmN [Holosporales bacterium]